MKKTKEKKRKKHCKNLYNRIYITFWYSNDIFRFFWMFFYFDAYTKIISWKSNRAKTIRWVIISQHNFIFNSKSSICRLSMYIYAMCDMRYAICVCVHIYFRIFDTQIVIIMAVTKQHLEHRSYHLVLSNGKEEYMQQNENPMKTQSTAAVKKFDEILLLHIMLSLLRIYRWTNNIGCILNTECCYCMFLICIAFGFVLSFLWSKRFLYKNAMNRRHRTWNLVVLPCICWFGITIAFNDRVAHGKFFKEIIWAVMMNILIT